MKRVAPDFGFGGGFLLRHVTEIPTEVFYKFILPALNVRELTLFGRVSKWTFTLTEEASIWVDLSSPCIDRKGKSSRQLFWRAFDERQPWSRFRWIEQLYIFTDSTVAPLRAYKHLKELDVNQFNNDELKKAVYFFTEHLLLKAEFDTSAGHLCELIFKEPSFIVSLGKAIAKTGSRELALRALALVPVQLNFSGEADINALTRSTSNFDLVESSPLSQIEEKCVCIFWRNLITSWTINPEDIGKIDYGDLFLNFAWNKKFSSELRLLALKIGHDFSLHEMDAETLSNEANLVLEELKKSTDWVWKEISNSFVKQMDDHICGI